QYISEKDPDILYSILLQVLQSRSTPYDESRIHSCYMFAREAHKSQVRASGEEYICHPLAVAITLARYNVDEDSIMAGMLHDVVEDCTGYTFEIIEKKFGSDIAHIVAGVTKITKMNFSTKEEAAAENIRKMILAMTTDLRVILVKLADRLHNLHTLSSLSIAKQQRIAHESLEIYAPIANRLGLHRIKLQLEDLGLAYTKPEVYRQIQSWVERYEIREKNLFEETIQTIKTTLLKNDIKANVYGRVKQIYSIYKKMQNTNMALEDLHDIIAFRVLVDKISDCYAVLGLIHYRWKFIPTRFKDYISLPKNNGYQSLHTTIFSSLGARMEVQIRTNEMHELAEYGVASHWLYKEKNRVRPNDVQQYHWLNKIIEEKILEEDSTTFLQSLRLELFQDEVYVFTPQGALLELPEGSCPIDFAYAIHTELGEKCTGSRINNVIKPLNTVLQHGDIVEILVDPKREPSRNWLNFVKTAKARTKIKAFLRKKERMEHILIGKSMVEKLLKKYKIAFSRLAKKDIILLADTIENSSIKTFDDFFVLVANGTLSAHKILVYFPEVQGEDKNEKVHEKHIEIQPKEHKDIVRRDIDGISLSGMNDILLEYASCCNPVFGDAIIGYISRGRGVVVHNIYCKHLNSYEAERLISLTWEGHPNSSFSTKLILRLTGMHALQEITTFFLTSNITVEEATFKKLAHGAGEAQFTIEVPDITFLYKAIQELESLSSVKEVYRV
ncbi:MAG: bifunctional (p)ppGpp synthetase/guanosine-3',5'-bis(diphosphate) 3'-pyrophosphohydrolase, partial [Desulfovibrionaceae bacterium]|nr:bifunctional (p)ppGpp synthetase/guanosine-3',5'-bis(diphosphate) 3'-pyrophosphohydrolase [Desulfovibrionaceae bacterium]